MSGEWQHEDSGYENGNGETTGRDREWERGDRGETRRSQSPRSRSPRRERSPRPREDRPKDDAEVNPGSNLFVSGIAPRMLEDELEELFGKYGQVDKVQIMVDPHTRESRGFGFVQMHTAEDADAAKDALTGEEKYGRVLTIEKARRGRARTPTPGKYFGPPKRDGPPRRGPPRDYDRGYGGRDRYEGGGGRGGYDGDRYDGRRRDYGDSYERHERPRYDDRYAPSRGSYSRRDDYYYDSRR